MTTCAKPCAACIAKIPRARILVTGCYAQRAPEELAALPGVEWVVGNSHKTQIADLVNAAPYHSRHYQHGQHLVGDIFAQHEFLSAPVEDAAGDRTRPNLKIQDGCNNRCSFCIIPFVRGRSRSAPADQVVEQVRNLSRALSRGGAERHQPRPLGPGAGQPHAPGRSHPPSARRNRNRAAAAQFGRADGFLRRSAGPDGRFAAHRQACACAAAIGLATASCAACIASTGRGTTRIASSKARRLMPDCAVGADVMVGFPGETDADFEESRQLHRGPAVHLPARLHLLGTARHAGRGNAGPGTDARSQRAQSRYCANWPRARIWPSAAPCSAARSR